MTPEQRFLFDLNGFLIIRGALTPLEVEDYRAGVYDLARNRLDNSQWTDDGQPAVQIRVPRPVDRDPRFLDLVDHPASLPVIETVIGEPGILIDNDVELTPPGNKPLEWHRGIGTHGYHADEQAFHCLMVKCIWYLTDCGPGDGCTRIVPGSHKSAVSAPAWKEPDGPPGAVDVAVSAGDLLVFSEACLHAGSANTGAKVRANMYFNYGPSWVSPWEGYRPSAEIVDTTQGVRRQLLGGGRVWGGTEEEGRQATT